MAMVDIDCQVDRKPLAMTERDYLDQFNQGEVGRPTLNVGQHHPAG